MRFSDVIADIPVLSFSGPEPHEVTGLTKDSREVRRGYIFVATASSAAYVDEAVRKGALALVSDTDVRRDGVCSVVVADTRSALGRMAARFFGQPSRSMHVTGITGTNGKTTTSYLIESMLKTSGKKAGVVGTISYRYEGMEIQRPNTTPESTELQSLLSGMKASGVGHVVMEVSSHALDQKRVEGIEFDAAVFTNLTHDHLDYHRDLDHYREAKQLLFQHYLAISPKPRRYAIINADDPAMGAFVPPSPITTLLYSMDHTADANLHSLEESIEGLKLGITMMGREMSLQSPLVGTFNVSNILAACLFGHTVDMAHEEIARGIEALSGVPGRLERIVNDRSIHVFVDYAHTPDALEKTIKMVKALSPGRVIVVFGCGGDRDRTKRPVMGRIASTLADITVVTSDNPRTEDPRAIIEEIRQGLDRGGDCHIIEDRREAIAEAIGMAKPGDTVLIAGKGHEDYQIIGATRSHFSDREVAQEYLNVAA
jgi:UDP-N-acetylmuramoyl-L-alanyl-D-glutamate--2,6-diaminopimelate ligase